MELILEIGIFFVPFVMIFLVASALISILGGWRDLAEDHPYNWEKIIGVTKA